jgi:serine protease inhibitor ecotin
MIYLFLFGLLLICIATATSWAGAQEQRLADIAMAPWPEIDERSDDEF